MGSFQVVLNADMGESFGCYVMGKDEELMPYLSAVNLACGFHAGDPVVMYHSVQNAKKNGISIGAHPGFKDLQGFGRRMLCISEEELYTDLMYQFGALDSFIRREKAVLTHVCPHGLLDPLVSNEEKYGRVMIRAIKEYKPDMVLIIEENCLLARLCEEEGIRVACVGYPDLEYDSDGNMIITQKKTKLDPQKIAQQSLRMVKDHQLMNVEGRLFPIKVQVLCFHSDVPNSLEILKAVRFVLLENGVDIVSF
jgi:UPF0271 protein